MTPPLAPSLKWPPWLAPPAPERRWHLAGTGPHLPLLTRLACPADGRSRLESQRHRKPYDVRDDARRDHGPIECQQPSARNAGSKRHLAGDQMRHSHAGDAGHGADRVAVAQVQPDPEQGERPPETDGVDVGSEEHTSELQSPMGSSNAVF